ncbi:MAG: Gp37 family protein [Syntrophobacteraceae bacterium]|nr:DUF1834 family protein [Desulfobacteraceae bacterium]
MHTLAEIEQAIVDRLKQQVPGLRECGSLGSVLLEEIEDLALRCPAAYVAYLQGDYGYATSGVQDRRMRFAITLVVRNEWGDKAARHGRGGEAGVYKLLDDVRVALTGQTCGLSIDPILPQSERAEGGSGELAAYRITIETRCRFTL